MKVSEHLKAAKALVADPAGWTQGVFFTQETAQSRPSRCALGGIYDSSGSGMEVYKQNDFYVGQPTYAQLDASRMAIKLLAQAITELGHDLIDPHHTIASYNNRHTHDEVMAVFDRAIELAEAKERWDELVAAEQTAAAITMVDELGAPVIMSLVRG